MRKVYYMVCMLAALSVIISCDDFWTRCLISGPRSTAIRRSVNFWYRPIPMSIRWWFMNIVQIMWWITAAGLENRNVWLSRIILGRHQWDGLGCPRSVVEQLLRCDCSSQPGLGCYQETRTWPREWPAKGRGSFMQGLCSLLVGQHILSAVL